jgi:hypothetical protein
MKLKCIKKYALPGVTGGLNTLSIRTDQLTEIVDFKINEIATTRGYLLLYRCSKKLVTPADGYVAWVGEDDSSPPVSDPGEEDVPRVSGPGNAGPTEEG